MKNKHLKPYDSKTVVTLLAIFNLILTSCNQNSVEHIDITNKLLDNNKQLVVKKNNKETTSIGVFTKHDYGTSHSFTYKLSINSGDINWDGGSGEPKHVLFFKDTTYIHFLKDKYIREEYTDTIDNTIKYSTHYELQNNYQKHIDKRYFFNLFGDDFWLNITPEQYTVIKQQTKEYQVPNDNELSFNPIDKD